MSTEHGDIGVAASVFVKSRGGLLGGGQAREVAGHCVRLPAGGGVVGGEAPGFR